MRYDEVYDDEDGPSAVTRLLDGLLQRPAFALLAFLTAGSLIATATNALYLQPGAHPAPMFSTRSRAASEETPATGSIDTLQRTAAPVPARAATVGSDPALIRDIQRLLAERELYAGPVDGVPGAQTRSAIETFQRNQGQAVDGEATPRLLALLALAPPPRTPPAPSVPVRGETGLPAGYDSRVARIQAALDELGFEPGAIDGLMGNATRLAIQRFELSLGVDPSGETSPQLIERLERRLGRPL
ncbi:MAG: peptidoglycan-binding protein [Hyphomicrobiaceae bacterium]|nr:peptidoglycan-binding protein [Hyphomicrobiaceae bacterium]